MAFLYQNSKNQNRTVVKKVKKSTPKFKIREKISMWDLEEDKTILKISWINSLLVNKGEIALLLVNNHKELKLKNLDKFIIAKVDRVRSRYRQLLMMIINLLLKEIF